MQTLLFQMEPQDGHEEFYFAHVAALRPLLAQQQGLLFIQRYKSLSRPNLILSHSLWRNEASIAQWRANKDHQTSQAAGRYKHFKDYRISISKALFWHSNQDEQEHWHIENTHPNSTQTEPGGTANRFVSIIRHTRLPTSDDTDNYKSVSETDSFLSVSEFSEQEAGDEQCLAAQSDKGTISVVLASVSRDYGMHDRAEAPQTFNPVEH